MQACVPIRFTTVPLSRGRSSNQVCKPTETTTFYHRPSTTFQLEEPCMTIWQLTRPPLVVMYRRTIPPTLWTQHHHLADSGSSPIRWSVRVYQSCTLPPRTGAAELCAFNQKVQSWLLRRSVEMGSALCPVNHKYATPFSFCISMIKWGKVNPTFAPLT